MSPTAPHRGPWLRFLASFVTLWIVFEALYSTVLVDAEWFASFLRIQTAIGGALLRLFEDGVWIDGARFGTSRFALEVRRGCDALQPIGIFAAALASFPARISSKIVGLLFGAGAMLSLNQARIVSLYFVGLHAPESFELAHQTLWPVAFLLLAFGLWMGWIARVAHHAPSAR